jgi:hypothetical protein
VQAADGPGDSAGRQLHRGAPDAPWIGMAISPGMAFLSSLLGEAKCRLNTSGYNENILLSKCNMRQAKRIFCPNPSIMGLAFL